MEYTVNALSRIAGVSKRTLHYYDEIALLSPKRKSSNGYRIYGEQEIEKLQQILFYRNLGLPLEKIKQILDDAHFDSETALLEHRQHLLTKKAQINQLLNTIDKTLANNRGESKMSDKEKFEGFKKELIEINEEQYGEEIREKYGAEAVEQSKKQFAGLNQVEYERMQQLGTQLLDELKVAMQTTNSKSEEVLKIAAMHKEWLSFTWPTYSKEAHRGVAQMYVDDPRFTKYYDEPAGKGAAAFLRDAIFNYTR